MSERLSDLFQRGTYLSYAYSYPHKTAYRPLTPPVRLAEAWADERREALFLYLHVPFCEQRCGFCNLYTQVRPRGGVESRYVDAVERQAAAVHAALRATPGTVGFARLAIGGGTPTFLGVALLSRVFRVARSLGVGVVPTSVEVSPGTLDPEQAALLRDEGVSRVSLGVQSVFEAETSAVSRGQAARQVEVAMRLLAGIPTRNVDLIYGLPGQTESSLRASIDQVIAWGANEIYLYPLYVRPLTGLGRRGGSAPEDPRRALYRVGRDHLRTAGWWQGSMRAFHAPGDVSTHGPVYRCQEDGMVGLGAGARSYTRSLHYASPFAVAQTRIRSGIEAWMEQADADFAVAGHGIRLVAEEQRRRFLLLSLLDTGLARGEFVGRFGADVLALHPELVEALELGLLVVDDTSVRLTESGVEHADVLGEWLQSPAVKAARRDWVAE